MGNWKRVCLSCLGLTTVRVSHFMDFLIMGLDWHWQVLGKELYSTSFQTSHPVRQCLQVFHLDVFIIYSNCVPTLLWFGLWLFQATSISETSRIIQTGFLGLCVSADFQWACHCAWKAMSSLCRLSWGDWVHGLSAFLGHLGTWSLSSSAPLSKWLETAQ